MTPFLDDRVAAPWLVYPAAILAIVLLLAAVILIRRRRSSRGAGIIFLVISVVLHVALLVLLPMIAAPEGGGVRVAEDEPEVGSVEVALSAFDPDLNFDDQSSDDSSATEVALPIAELTDRLAPPPPPEPDEIDPAETLEVPPATLADIEPISDASLLDAVDEWIDDLEPAPEPAATPEADPIAMTQPAIEAEPKPIAEPPLPQSVPPSIAAIAPAVAARPAAANIEGKTADDFGARKGAAKAEAIARTGGDIRTEAAVAAALRFLADGQRPDGSWDPQASGAGRERQPLGIRRPGAGMNADTGLTGLALLSFIGAGNTHREGEYADQVYRGLAYLIRSQKPDGSLAGDASIYASTYCHGMAALALCETAAMTDDPSAVEAAKRAVAYTQSLQHPTTGGWRYTRHDRGDLSQLGWQAMVVDAAHRADVPMDPRSVAGIERFLTSVRGGRNGGLASYRPGELPSRTMTAEALATKLLIGVPVPDAEVAEAEQYLLSELPGTSVDNYYYWYYATIALHQLQDDAWDRWNDALKGRLLATQTPDGAWNASTLWGGYGGTVYTTAMATLCLESYYRHVVRDEAKVAAEQRLDRR